MRSRFSLAVVCVAAIGCSRTQPVTTEIQPPETSVVPAQPSVTDTSSTGYLVGQPITHENLTIFPVLSIVDRNDDRFITLSEGLKAGSVNVYEVGAIPDRRNMRVDEGDELDEDRPASAVSAVSGEEEVIDEDEMFDGDVNRLMVVNRSDKPLYLMPGEVIIGGSQDRTIAQSAIITAHSEPTEIDVYCVEHGRWGQRTSADTSVVLNAFAVEIDEAKEFAAEARQGKFVVQGGVLNKGSRIAATDGKGQQEVWDEVAKANGKLNVNSSSGAFTYNFVDEEVAEKVMPYRAALDKFAEQERVVGVIVVINGKVETVDVFESTPLFRKFWPKLMTGYCLDALHAVDETTDSVACRRDDAEQFLLSVIQDQSEETQQSKDGLVVSRRENDKSVSFSAGGAGMGGMGGFGGGVHSSGFSK